MTLYRYLIDEIFPLHCVGCGKEDMSLCIPCLSRVPLASRNGTIDPTIMSLFDYKHPVIRRAIWLLKYRRHRAITENLGRMIYEYLIDDLSERQALMHFTRPLLMPIPSTSRRKRMRGFNQAELLVQSVMQYDREHALSIDTRSFKKIRHTKPQAQIRNKSERLNNLLGAFAVTHPEHIKGRNIILIDDVTTTGATLCEAKKTLLAAGAKKVIGLSVAH